MIIVGLNSDMYISAACLLREGALVAAAAEERFSREKRSRRFPASAIDYCLREAGVTADSVDYWAVSWNPGAYFCKFNPLFSGQRRHMVEQLYSIPDNLMAFYDRTPGEYVYQEVPTAKGAMRTYYVTHHRAHAANAFFLSPFASAAIMTADSQGEFESTTLCQGRDGVITRLDGLRYPHSLGVLYSAFTDYLGFRPNSDEWKVMAMGAYDHWDNAYYRLLTDTVVRPGAGDWFELDLSFFSGFLHDGPHQFSSKLEALFGPARQPEAPVERRHNAIAAALQRCAEDIALGCLRRLHAMTGEENLTLSGGFFMNSVLNGKVLGQTPFKRLFISSCPDDSGNALGAALYVHNQILGRDRSRPMTHNFFGPEFDDAAIEHCLRECGCAYTRVDDPARTAAALVAAGNIVGWFQGRMEFGQRALGARSILADPREAAMKDRVNASVKFREAFRPFAPAVLAERADEYFELDAGVEVPFMEKVYPIRPEKRAVIPAVTHADGSGRLQTVRREANPRYYDMIRHFGELTGVPVVLNTSFNLNGEPIVCTPADAVRTFSTCGLDALCIGSFVLRKPQAGHGGETGHDAGH